MILCLSQHQTISTLLDNPPHEELTDIILKLIRRLHSAVGDRQFRCICRTIPSLRASYQQLIQKLYGYSSFLANLWNCDNNIDISIDTQILDNFSHPSIQNSEVEAWGREFVRSTLEQLPVCDNSLWSEFTSFEEEVWWRNIISGAAYKLAQQYFEEGYPEEASILFLKIAKLTQEDRSSWRTLNRSNSEFENILASAPNPDEEFHKYWQAYLVSIKKQILTGQYLNTFVEPQDRQVNFLYYFEHLERLHLPPKPLDWFLNRSLSRWEDELECLQNRDPYYSTFRYLKTLKGHSRSVYAIAFHPDGQILASGSADRTIKLWNLSKTAEIATLRGHSASILSVAISPDGQLLASGSADGTIKLWNLLKIEEIAILRGHTGSVSSVAISPDGQILASGSIDGTIKIWNLSKIEEIATLWGQNGAILSVAISPDGQTLAAGNIDGTIQLWNLANRQNSYRDLKQTLGKIYAICFCKQGQMLASANGDRILLWNLEKTIATEIVPAYTSVTASPDGNILAAGGSFMSIVDISKKQFIRSFPQKSSDSLPYHDDYIYAVAFAPNGRVLASASRDCTIKLWGIPQPFALDRSNTF